MVFTLHDDESQILQEAHRVLQWIGFTGVVYWREREKERWVDGVGEVGEGHSWLESRTEGESAAVNEVRWSPHGIMAFGFVYYFLTAFVAWMILERWWI